LYKTTTETTSTTKVTSTSTGNGNGKSIKTSTVTSTSQSTASPITVSLSSSVSSASTSSYSSIDTSAAGMDLDTALFTATSTYPQSSTTITTSLTSTSTGATTTKYTDWTTFFSNGANLRNWLEIEESNDQYFWNAYVNGTAVQDEWTFCEVLGDDCGPILEQHYSTYVTTDTINNLASVGVNFLLISTTYAAWVVVPGSELYPSASTRCQVAPMVSTLEKHWDTIPAILTFIEASAYPWAYTVGVLNEASDNPSGFATAAGMTQNGTDWIVDWTKTVMNMISDSTTPKVPTMLQDCFLGEEHWSPYFDTTNNLVIDTHIYYFAAAGVYSGYAVPAICGQASAAPGDGNFPVFIGEWSLQTLYNNTYANREELFNTQPYAWSHYFQGGAF
ncbi:glycoside hydrolase, partial [Aureobasidium melanogenum]